MSAGKRPRREPIASVLKRKKRVRSQHVAKVLVSGRSDSGRATDRDRLTVAMERVDWRLVGPG